MSNYYDYRDVKVSIAHKLMTMDGWKVYGYHSDNSDPMTDYYDPADWGGVAEKNGYILCVDVYGEAKPYEVKQYTENSGFDSAAMAKIKKLEEMTVERGASESEEATAREKIAKLREKQTTERAYRVVEVIPGHMAHPTRCNWHIEKDGVIIDKGNGLLKYAEITKYFQYPHYSEDLALFRKDADKWEKETAEHLWLRGYYEKERAEEVAKNKRAEMAKDVKKVDAFLKFINKIDTTCGGLLGDGDGYIYEKVTVTEYKKEMKAIEKSSGKIEEGACFILKTSFNYGCHKGLVYRIHETEYNGKKLYHAYKMNGKLTKECTGNSSPNNHWYTLDDKFEKWVEKGAIAFCDIVEVKTPYEVEKVIKKKVSNAKAEKTTAKKAETETTKAENQVPTEKEISYAGCDFLEIEESTHTKTGAKIWLVKLTKKITRDDFLELKKDLAKIGGYYSNFTHSFVFKENPADKIGLAA